MADRIAGCERRLREAGNKEARHTDLACMEEEKGVHVTTMGYRLEKEGRLAVARFGDIHWRNQSIDVIIVPASKSELAL
jgi:hypothetical protein